MSFRIERLRARQALDSRGRPTPATLEVCCASVAEAVARL